MKNRKSRIVARGEFSNHSHIITGECEITVVDGKTMVKAGKNCAIKHLLEKQFVEEGVEIWTKEHKDIELKKGGTYEVIQQVDYNPYLKLIQQVKD